MKKQVRSVNQHQRVEEAGWVGSSVQDRLVYELLWFRLSSRFNRPVQTRQRNYKPSTMYASSVAGLVASTKWISRASLNILMKLLAIASERLLTSSVYILPYLSPRPLLSPQPIHLQLKTLLPLAKLCLYWTCPPADISTGFQLNASIFNLWVALCFHSNWR